jgi:serine/threonine protein kinase
MGVLLDVVLQVVGAVMHLHGLGIVHRDLRAANVLVQSLDPVAVMLADFGLSHVMPAFVGVEPAVAAKLCASDMSSVVTGDAALRPIEVCCGHRGPPMRGAVVPPPPPLRRHQCALCPFPVCDPWSVFVSGAPLRCWRAPGRAPWSPPPPMCTCLGACCMS